MNFSLAVVTHVEYSTSTLTLFRQVCALDWCTDVPLVCVFVCVILAPDALLLSQFDRAGLGSNGNPVLVQRFDQNLSHVFVVWVEVEDISHHVRQTFVREFLLGGKVE